MRRVGGGGGRFPKPSQAPSTASEATPALDASAIRDLGSAISRRDSDATSLCSSRAASAAPRFSDRATQAAALRVVNGFLAPAVTLRGTLPPARDIQAALRLLVDRLHLLRSGATFEDDLVQDLRLLGCPYRVTRSALKAPGTPHSWPVVLAALHWLTLFCYAQGDDLDAPAGPSGDLLLYSTQGYSHFLMGEDDAVAALDEEYASKARMTGEASVAEIGALEKEAQELGMEVNKLISGPSRRQVLEAEKESFGADIDKFEVVVDSWKTKINERENVLGDLEKELEAKVSDAQRAAAEIQHLVKQLDAQPVNVRDIERMHREMQGIEDDIANAEKEKAALEDNVWEVEAKLVSKLEELENLERLNDLQKQLQGNVKALEEERDNIFGLQAKNDEMVASLNSLDREIINDDSRFTSEAGRMKDELEKKKNNLISLEKQADDFFKISEKRLQDARFHAEEGTQAAAKDLLELLDGMAEHKEFMETTIAQRRKNLYETADYIAGLFAATS